jgi:hypothetical protein
MPAGHWRFGQKRPGIVEIDTRLELVSGLEPLCHPVQIGKPDLIFFI